MGGGGAARSRRGSFHTNYGVLEAEEEREETTANLPEGTLRLDPGLPEPAAGVVQHQPWRRRLVDLNLRCGTSRVNVVYLPADAVLTITVEARRGANFAYRVSRI